MARTYTAAIIGLGGFSRRHAWGFAQSGRTRLVAVCDLKADRWQWWKEQVRPFASAEGVRFYTDAATMLEQVRPDVVGITTKHDQHAPLTILCAREGVKGVICEKPMAMNLAEADAMLRACGKSGTKLAIGHQRRFNQEWQAALRLVQRGAIGKVLHAVSRWPDESPAKYRYDIFGGGPLMFLSIHSIDLLRYFLGDVRAVTGQIDMGEAGIDCESRAYGVLEFKSGARAVVECGTGIGQAATLGHSVVFYGEKGTVHVCDGHGARYKSLARPRWRQVRLNREILPWQVGVNYACRDQVKDLVRAIEKDEQPRVCGQEGRADLEVVMALYQSERTGGLVKLPLKEKCSPLLAMNRAGGFGEVTWRVQA